MKKVTSMIAIALACVFAMGMISCDGGGGGGQSDYVNANPATINFAAAGGTEYVAVSSNTTWTVTANAGWITAVKENNTVKVTVGAATETRNGTFTLNAGTATATVNVVQTAGGGGADVIFDDFEGHTDFDINSPGTVGWNYIDGDGGATYGIGNAVEYPNKYAAMAAQIVNPTGAGVSSSGNFYFDPYSGNKYLGFVACESMANNDWFISPLLNYTESFKFAFWAQSVTNEYGLERMRVAYSTGGMTQSDFTNVLTSGSYVEVPTAGWTRYEFTLPVTAKYVAINCVSNDAYLLMVDDVAIGTGTLPNMAPPAPAFAPVVTGDAPAHLFRTKMK